MIGTAWATFPTSSSVCIIFLIRPYKQTMSLIRKSVKNINENNELFVKFRGIFMAILTYRRKPGIVFSLFRRHYVYAFTITPIIWLFRSLHQQSVHFSRIFEVINGRKTSAAYSTSTDWLTDLTVFVIFRFTMIHELSLNY